MKTSPPLRKRGFTLVELLVVIAIIAVLASFVTVAAQKALESAKKTKAKTVAAALKLSIDQYYNDYSKFPITSTNGGDADSVIGTTSSSDAPDVSKKPANGLDDARTMFNALLGKEADSDDMLNPRKITYLNLSEGKAKRDGLIYQNNTIQGLFDPWGKGYVILLDTNYDNDIDLQNTANQYSTSANNLLRGQRCAVYSAGGDTKSKNATTIIDDARTW